jgi:LEA14-like dessication related protein
MTLFEQRYQLQLRVQNPNDLDLPVEGLHCTLYINEREFAQGVGGGVMVPRFGEAVLTVNVVSNLQRVFEQFRSAGETTAKPVSYRLVGRLSVEGYSAAVPFEYQGEFDLRMMHCLRRLKPRPAGVPSRQMFRWTPGA